MGFLHHSRPMTWAPFHQDGRSGQEKQQTWSLGTDSSLAQVIIAFSLFLTIFILISSCHSCCFTSYNLKLTPEIIFPQRLSLLEVYTGSPHPSALPTKHTHNLMNGSAFFWREEKPTLTSPTPSLCVVQGPYLLSQYVGGLIWAGPRLLAVLTSQVVSNKFASWCFRAPLPNSSNIVFSSLLCLSIFPLTCGWYRMWYIHSMLCFFAQELIRIFQKWFPSSDSILSGVPCHHNMCYSRPKTVFWAVAWFTGYVSSQPVAASTMMKM